MHVMDMLTESQRMNENIVSLGSPWSWALPLFALLALLVLLLTGNNVSLFSWMNMTMSLAPDSFWIHLTLLGDGQMVILFALPFLGRRADVVWQFVFAIVLGGIFVYGLKELFSTLRPPAILLPGSFHLIGPDLQNNSFPSGHTTALFVLAGLVCLQRVNQWYKWMILLLATLVGFSRIALGVHWPIDVLGAVIGGWLVASLSILLAQYFHIGQNIWVQRFIAILITATSINSVWNLWHNYEKVYPGTGAMQVSLLLICLALSVSGQLRLFNLKH